jgi:hypothetical protein
MHPVLRSFIDFFTSLRLTVVLLGLSIVLVFWATIAQVNLGIWAVQEIYFRSFFVLKYLPGTQVPVPVFPGGYFLGGLLLINLLAAHIYRFKLSWRKSGILLTHVGIVVLLLGELFTGLFAEESRMVLDEGQTKAYSESFLKRELAIIDTSHPEFDEVVAIPLERLARAAPIQHPGLPFRLQTRAFYTNSGLSLRSQVPNAPPSLATTGIGPDLVVTPMRPTYKPDEQNIPSAFVELIGPQGSLGVWLLSTLRAQPQTVVVDGRTYQLQMRPTRFYKDFAITLLEFSHDRYPGTEIPRNFSSRVRLLSPATGDDREVLIYMNNPLRHGGYTFYQAGFDNDDTTSIFQVVQNPSWLLPYLSCLLLAVGLCVQFGIHLFGFVGQRRQNAARPAAPAVAVPSADRAPATTDA